MEMKEDREFLEYMLATSQLRFDQMIIASALLFASN